RTVTVFASGAAALIGIGAAVVVRLLGRDGRTPPERRRRARARHVFPLGLGQQAVGLAGLARNPGHVGLGVLPADVDNRPLTPTPALSGRLVAVPPAVGDTHIPLIEGHGIPACGERRGDRHLHLRLAVKPLWLVRW